MKVNMTPNPLDVVTIHASQGDTEARQWEFELHNNGELIDTSDVTEQMFFKAYKGGTEQILPENTSTPTTSPFIGDIKYPQGLLTDQEFTYRQSPTESDGLAKITDIKGNTLVWNQLVQNGNFESTSGWLFNNCSGSTSNNVCNISVTAGTKGVNFGLSSANAVNKVIGHKYLFAFNVKVSVLKTDNLHLNLGWSVSADIPLTANVDTRYSTIFSATETSTRFFVYPWGTHLVELVGDETVNVHDYMCIDLTQMFGTGNEPTTVEEFTSLFPLPYYAYDSGSLLSFNGNGIKTVGKNQVANIVRGYFLLAQNTFSFDNDSESFVFYAIKGMTYVSSSAITLNRNAIARCDSPNLVNGSPIYDVVNTSRTWTATWTGWAVWYVYSSRNEVVENSAQVEFGTTATAYEPYTSSTLSLPISTYFPTGMKSAGNVYDELTPSKAITRIGVVDLGSLEWAESSTNIFRCQPPGMNYVVSPPYENRQQGAMCSEYSPSQNISISSSMNDKSWLRTGYEFFVRDTSYSDAVAFKTAMNGVYLYYELATPTETSFTTASLVTENAEIPLSNEDGVLIGKCTEQLSENPGFIDAKIKLSDSDGTCYSNKLQLHVERSPQ